MSTKEKVLELLKQAPQTISGEKMAHELALSRTSIWKAVKELEKEGYHIAHEANGYQLLTSDVLSEKEIRTLLAPDTPIETIEVRTTSDSTMKDAKKLTFDDGTENALIVADTQTNARGRFGRPFFAKPSQGIYMSLLLHPKRTFAELPQYTVVMAVAVSQAVDKLAKVNTQIKWVNDIYLEGKKLCGILTEAMSDIETQQIAHIIIGIGLNFSIPKQEFDQDIQTKAASLFPDGDPSFTRNELIAEIMNQFFALLDSKDETIRKYREKSFVLGKTVRFSRQGKMYEGVADTINDLGELIVIVDGKEQVLSSGEISLSGIGE